MKVDELSNGNFKLPMCYGSIDNIEGTTTFDNKKLTTKGKLGIQLLKNHPKWGDQVQLSIFSLNHTLLDVRCKSKWFRQEIYIPINKIIKIRDILNEIIEAHITELNKNDD